MPRPFTRFEPDAGRFDSPSDRATARSEGPAVAAVLAGGIGAAALGFLTTMAEASERVKGWLELSSSVGPLSGKTVFAVCAWLVSWMVLHPLLKERARLTTAVLIMVAVLIGIGVVGTFPVFFELFASD